MSDQYVVAIKPSARRINAAAGEYVNRSGAVRPFESKADARDWADTISADRDAVRVQDAAPNDPAPIDGYLVADPVRRRTGRPGSGSPAAESLEPF